jgi:hypothetical protein
MTRLVPVTAALCVLASLAPAAPEGKFFFVDLKPYANQKLTDNFGSGRAGNDLKALRAGGRTFAGVNFKIGEGVIQLGSKLLQAEKPSQVEGIKVGRACAKIHIRHATGYGNGQVVGEEGKEGDPLFVADGTKIAEYQIRYADGSSAAIPVVYGQDVRDWWFNDKSRGVTRGKVVWEGDNELAKEIRSRIRLYLTSWDNPHPAKQIASINYIKTQADSPAAPFCVAITLEAKK